MVYTSPLLHKGVSSNHGKYQYVFFIILDITDIGENIVRKAGFLRISLTPCQKHVGFPKVA